VAEEGGEAVPEDAAGDDVVAVAVGAERCLRVVHVQHPHALQPDACVEIAERRRERLHPGDVDARCPPVAGVEADAEPRVGVEHVEERGELGHGAADRAARPGRVLEAEPQLVGRELEELLKGRRHELDRLLEAVPQV
jgi:hypothetical protein